MLFGLCATREAHCAAREHAEREKKAVAKANASLTHCAFLMHHHDCELDAKIHLPHPDSIESFDLI
jgi:hypothetical protein